MEKIVHKTTNKQKTSDFHYWQSQPLAKRLEALEQICQKYHQIDTSMLNSDFKEFIQLLNENQVKYLVIGVYAVAVHGHLLQLKTRNYH
jgi:hypothetical protein